MPRADFVTELQKVLDRIKYNKKEKYPAAGRMTRKTMAYKEVWIDCGSNANQSATISSHVRACKEFNLFLDRHDAVCGLHIDETGIHSLQVRI